MHIFFVAAAILGISNAQSRGGMPAWVAEMLAAQGNQGTPSPSPFDMAAGGQTMPPWLSNALGNQNSPTSVPASSVLRDVELQPNFEVERYMGRWYEIFRHKDVPFQNGTDATATYTLQPNGTVLVENREFKPELSNWGRVQPALATPNGNARFLVKFPRFPAGDYRVLYTDYDNIAIVYGSGEYVGYPLVYAWVLAREPRISPRMEQMAMRIFEERTGITRDDLEKTQHGLAARIMADPNWQPRVPDSQPTMPAWVSDMLAGQGNQGGVTPRAFLTGGGRQTTASVLRDVRLQRNFNAERYMGRWYEVFRHKDLPYGNGTDTKTTYTLWPNGTVKIENREFRPSTNNWGGIDGMAVPNGNARFIVKFATFPDGDYRVLYTDYDNIALVYGSDTYLGYPLVYAWILSRQPTISRRMEEMAMRIFEERTGITRDDFEKTKHGVAAAAMADPNWQSRPPAIGPANTMPAWVSDMLAGQGNQGGVTPPAIVTPGGGQTMPSWVADMLGNNNRGSQTMPPMVGSSPSLVPIADPQVQLQPNFDINRYVGRWFEIYRHKNVAFESGTDNTATYRLFSNGSISITNQEWLPNTREWTIAKGVATVVSPARLAVQFGAGPKSDYRVLYTDYSNIALVYSKTTFYGISVVYGWVLARRPQISQQLDDMAFRIFRERTGVQKNEFHKTVHGAATGRQGPGMISMFGNVGYPVTVSGRAKCTYRVPTLTCAREIEPQIVYDYRTGRCGVQYTGCDVRSVKPYAFTNAQECFDTCIYRN